MRRITDLSPKSPFTGPCSLRRASLAHTAPTGAHWLPPAFSLALPFKRFLLFMPKLKCRSPSVAMAVVLSWAFAGV